MELAVIDKVKKCRMKIENMLQDILSVSSIEEWNDINQKYFEYTRFIIEYCQDEYNGQPAIEFLLENNDKHNVVYGENYGIYTNGNTIIPFHELKRIKDSIDYAIENYIELIDKIQENDFQEILSIYEEKRDKIVEKEKRQEYEKQQLKNINASGYVYIVRVNDYYKIGRTLNPNSRLGEYTFLMEQPETICCIYVEKYKQVEKELHEMFKGKRTNGEWFKLSEDELKQAIQYIEARKVEEIEEPVALTN